MTTHGSYKSSSSPPSDYCPPYCIEIDGVETTVNGTAFVAPANAQDPTPDCTWVFGDFTLEEFEDKTVIFRDNAGVKLPYANLLVFNAVLQNKLDFQGIRFEDCDLCGEKCITIDGTEIIAIGVPQGGAFDNNLPVCLWAFENIDTGQIFSLEEYFDKTVSFFFGGLQQNFPTIADFENELAKPLGFDFQGSNFSKCLTCVDRCLQFNTNQITEKPTFLRNVGEYYCAWAFTHTNGETYTLKITKNGAVSLGRPFVGGGGALNWPQVADFEAALAQGIPYDGLIIKECSPCPEKCISINGENITDEGEELGGDALNGLPVCQWIFPLAAGGSYALNEFFNGLVELEEGPLNIRQFQNMQDFDLKLAATIQFDGKEFTECDPCPEKCLRIDNDEITRAGQDLGGNAVNNLVPKCRWDFGDYILEEFAVVDGGGFKVFIEKVQGGAIEGYANMDDFDAAVKAGLVHGGDVKECFGCGKKCIAVNGNDLTSFGFDGGGDALNGQPVCYYNFDGYKLSIFFNGSVQLSKGVFIVKPFDNIGDFNQQLAAGFPFNGDVFSDCVGCPTKCVQIDDCDQFTSEGEAKGGNSTNGIAVCQWTFGIYTLDEYFDKTLKLSGGGLDQPFFDMAAFDQLLAAGFFFNGDDFSECYDNCGEICVNLNGNYITAQGEYGGGTANNSVKCVWKIGSFIEYTLEEYCDGQVFLSIGALDRGWSTLDAFKEDLVGVGFTFNNDQFQECLPCPNKCVNIDYQDFNSAGTQGGGAQGNQLPVCSWQFGSYELWELFDGSVILYFGSNQKPFNDMADFDNQLQQEFLFQGQVFAICGTEPPDPSSSYNPFNFSVALEDYQIACCNPSKILITSGEPWDGWQNINSNCTYDKTSVSEDLSQDKYYQYILYWNNEIQSWAFQGTTMNWTQENEFYGSTDPCNPEGEYSDGNKKLLISVI